MCIRDRRSEDVATVRVSYELLELFDMTIVPYPSYPASLGWGIQFMRRLLIRSVERS